MVINGPFFKIPGSHSRKSKRTSEKVGHKLFKLLASMVTTTLIVLPCFFFVLVCVCKDIVVH